MSTVELKDTVGDSGDKADLAHITLNIGRMTCASCVIHVENAAHHRLHPQRHAHHRTQAQVSNRGRLVDGQVLSRIHGDER